MSAPSTADLFFAGGSASASFDGTPPITHAGTITRVGDPMQQRDMRTGDPKVYSNGDPMMQLPVDIQTEERDTADDDGVRTLYVKSGMRNAIRDALRAAKADGLRVGGRLSVTYTGDDKPSAPGLNGAKKYTATYTPPAGTFFDEPAPAAPAAQPAPAAGAAPSPVDTARQLIAAGLPDDVVVASTGLTREVVAALRNV